MAWYDIKKLVNLMWYKVLPHWIKLNWRTPGSHCVFWRQTCVPARLPAQRRTLSCSATACATQAAVLARARTPVWRAARAASLWCKSCGRMRHLTNLTVYLRWWGRVFFQLKSNLFMLQNKIVSMISPFTSSHFSNKGACALYIFMKKLLTCKLIVM